MVIKLRVLILGYNGRGRGWVELEVMEKGDQKAKSVELEVIEK